MNVGSTPTRATYGSEANVGSSQRFAKPSRDFISPAQVQFLSLPLMFGIKEIDMRQILNWITHLFAKKCPSCLGAHHKLIFWKTVGFGLTADQYECLDCGRKWGELSSAI